MALLSRNRRDRPRQPPRAGRLTTTARFTYCTFCHCDCTHCTHCTHYISTSQRPRAPYRGCQGLLPIARPPAPIASFPLCVVWAPWSPWSPWSLLPRLALAPLSSPGATPLPALETTAPILSYLTYCTVPLLHCICSPGLWELPTAVLCVADPSLISPDNVPGPLFLIFFPFPCLVVSLLFVAHRGRRGEPTAPERKLRRLFARDSFARSFAQCPPSCLPAQAREAATDNGLSIRTFQSTPAETGQHQAADPASLLLAQFTVPLSSFVDSLVVCSLSSLAFFLSPRLLCLLFFFSYSLLLFTPPPPTPLRLLLLLFFLFNISIAGPRLVSSRHPPLLGLSLPPCHLSLSPLSPLGLSLLCATLSTDCSTTFLLFCFNLVVFLNLF